MDNARDSVHDRPHSPMVAVPGRKNCPTANINALPVGSGGGILETAQVHEKEVSRRQKGVGWHGEAARARAYVGRLWRQSRPA